MKLIYNILHIKNKIKKSPENAGLLKSIKDYFKTYLFTDTLKVSVEPSANVKLKT